MFPDEIFVENHVSGLEPQPSAMRHRIARVHAQVHEDLLELSGVRLYRLQVTRQIGVDLDVLSDDPLEHLEQVPDDVVEVQNVQLKDLLPAEGQHLSRQRGAAFRRQMDLFRGALLL